uniref:Uncharacterized protein n=2 Tax=Plectus sambesii TaxID=2011161 RepID=A0A914V1P9_9BILA
MLWRPDLYFANARKANFHDITVRNFLMYIEEDGTLTISLTVMCMMDLSKYPLDDQRCLLRILSYAYDKEDLIIEWHNDSAISQNPTIRIADMELLNTSAGPSCDIDYGTRKWSCVTAEFHGRRLRMHHYLQMYIPTGLIVVVSWLGFWIDPSAVPARVALVITTLLTITTQANSARVTLPAVGALFGFVAN